MMLNRCVVKTWRIKEPIAVIFKGTDLSIVRFAATMDFVYRLAQLVARTLHPRKKTELNEARRKSVQQNIFNYTVEIYFERFSNLIKYQFYAPMNV